MGWREVDRLQAAHNKTRVELRQLRGIIDFTIPSLERGKAALQAQCQELSQAASEATQALRLVRASESQTRRELFRLQQALLESTPAPTGIGSPSRTAAEAYARCTEKLAECKPAHKSAPAHTSGKGLSDCKPVQKGVSAYTTGKNLLDRKAVHNSRAVAAATSAVAKKPQGVQKKKLGRRGGKVAPVAAYGRAKKLSKGLERQIDYESDEEK